MAETKQSKVVQFLRADDKTSNDCEQSPTSGVRQSAPARDNEARKISDLIRNVRKLRILLLHPGGPEGKDLLEHLNRIGCQVSISWPPPDVVPAGTDVVLVAVREIVEGGVPFHWDAEKPPASLIAIVDYENPLIVERVLRLGAQTVIGLPLQPLGILANLLLSATNFDQVRKLQLRIDRLSSRLKANRDVSTAMSIIMQTHSVGEREAYELLRSQAMARRATIESTAAAIIQASDVLRMGLTHKPRS
jgi:AmiR/NasT family two-component response regulator